MFKKIPLRLKLTSAFLTIAVLLAGTSIYQIQSVGHYNELFTDLTSSSYKQLTALHDVNQLGSALSEQVLEYKRNIAGASVSTIATEKAKITSSASQLSERERQYRNLAATDRTVDIKDTGAMSAAVDSLVQKVNALSGGGATSSKQSESEVLAAHSTLSTLVEKAIAIQQLSIDVKTDEVTQTMTTLLNVIVIVAFAAMGLAILMGILVANWIARSISYLREGAERIANGNFLQPLAVHSHDELGQLATAFNGMSDRLKESYRRLDLEQRRDKAMLQSMGEGLIAIDEKGNIALINDTAIDLLGLSKKASAIGASIKDAYQLYSKDEKHDKPLTSDERPILRALTTGTAIDDVFIFHKSDGKKHLFNIIAEPVVMGGKVAGAITVLRDVTKEKEVDRMKTEFISLASHQLRTPLSAIKWFSEMLIAGDAGKLKPDQLEFAKNIGDSTERMISLVNALLNISRIESGRIMIVPQPTDLKELVTGIVTDLKAKTAQKKQTLLISVHAELPKINLDPRLIGQVYLNLLTNAIKYTPEGGEISVFISKKGDQVISQITDSGYGIPKNQQDRVFQKFFRAANAVKVETDGTGLGLYLIKSVVESSGGKIWFKSEEGKGSTFWFSIPLSGMKPKEGEVTLDV